MIHHSWLILLLRHFSMTSQCQLNPRLSEMILMKDLAAEEHAPQCQYLRRSSFLKATKMHLPLCHPINREPSLGITPLLRLCDCCFLSDESMQAVRLGITDWESYKDMTSFSSLSCACQSGFPDKTCHSSHSVFFTHFQWVDQNSNSQNLGVSFSFTKCWVSVAGKMLYTAAFKRHTLCPGHSHIEEEIAQHEMSSLFSFYGWRVLIIEWQLNGTLASAHSVPYVFNKLLVV